MAHPICGIDVGAYTIKFVVYEVGFRHTTFRGAFEEMVGDGPEPLLARQVQAVREGLSRVSSEATLYLTLPGDLLSIRALDLPFTDPRKIDQVIGFELEGQIVHALDEVVYDHVVVRTGPEGSSVLAVAARRDDVGAWLEALAAASIDPRALYAAPVIYHALDVEAGAVAEDPGKVPAVLDLGHQRSNLFVGREGQGMVARTITRGGRHLTAAIAEAFGVDLDRAEQAKRAEARLLTPQAPARSEIEAKLDTVLRGALAPLVRDVRQTLASFRASTRLEPSTLYLAGGGARLGGLLPFLEAELGVPVLFLPVANTLQAQEETETETETETVEPTAVEAVFDPAAAAEAPAGEGVAAGVEAPQRPRGRRGQREPETVSARVIAAEPSSFALASATAVAASRGRKEIDLRRGPFVYRASFSVLRQKAAHFAVLAGAVVLAAGLDVFAALSNLRSERKGLDAQLKAATSELFGQPRTDARAVTQLLRKGLREDLAPVPKATAFDLLDQISKRVPSDDDIKLDVGELDIRPKKTFIKGTVDSATAVDEIAEKLKQIDCYEEVTKGAVTEVSGEAKQFTLTFTSKCP